MELKEPHQMLRRWGGCKAILTLALLMLLSVVTAGKAAAQETKAYAVLKGNTLTFYYDDGYSQGENTWAFPSDDEEPDWTYNTKITKVEITENFHNFTPESCESWFDGLESLTEIKGIENINTSKVTSMSGMFQDCKSLTSLNLSSFNTAKVTDMSRMFNNCSALTLLDLRSFNTAKVTDMSNMFLRCSALTSLDLSSFNTAEVTDMRGMFSGCTALTSLDLSSFNNAQVKYMNSMFSGCTALTSLDLSSSNTTMVENMSYMFYGCSALTTILVDENLWEIKEGAIGDEMFYGCTNLVGGNGTKYDGRITDIQYAIIDGSDNGGETNPGYLTSIGQCEPYAMLKDNGDDGTKTLRFCFGYKPEVGMELTYENDEWPWSNNNDKITKVEFDNLFKYARPTSCANWFYGFTKLTEIKGIEYLNTSKVKDMSGMFYDCQSLTSLDLSSFNTEMVQYMSDMFFGCSALTSLDLSSFNTAKVKDMSGMFGGCSALTSLDLSSFNTAKVQDMSYMFFGCKDLTTILVVKNLWDDGGVSGDDMFFGCNSLVGGNGTSYLHTQISGIEYAIIDGGETNPGYLTSIGQCKPYAMVVDNDKTLRFCFGPKIPEDAMELTLPLYEYGTYTWPWNDKKSNITKVEFDNWFRHARPELCAGWFYGFTKLTVIKGIEYLNTSEVTSMKSMFSGCSALTSLNLSSFNTAEVTDMSNMFSGCSALTSLDLSSFNTASVTDMSHMFNRCEKLTSLDLSSFNTASVLKMYEMFFNCSALTSLDLSSFNTAKVTDMIGMFQGCKSLTTILVDENLWKVRSGASGNIMFAGCTNLVGGHGTKYDGRITGIQYARIDGSNGNPGYLTSIVQCEPYAMVVDNGKTLRFCFGPKLETLKPEGAKKLSSSNWNNFASSITKVEFDNLFRHARPTSCANWFAGFTKLTEIKGIEYLNTSEVTSMGSMFFNCKALTSLDLSSFDTEGVQDMQGMFQDCSALTSLDLSSFNTMHIRDMNDMFQGCSALTTILVDRNLWDLGAMGSKQPMFDGCTNLVGGNGTTYNKNNINTSYAIVDGDGNKPGYLTHNALKLTKSDGTTTAEIQGDFEYSIGAALLLDKDIKVSKVTFKREFTQGVTATIMLPFSFTVGNNINGTFHTLKSVAKDKNGEWTAELSNAITDIQANTPYIFYPKDGITSMEFTGDITLLHLTDDLTNGANDGWQLHGVYSKKIWTEDSKIEYGFAGEKVEEDGIEAGEFVRAGEGASADPMRCYLTYEGNGKPFTAKSSVVLPDRIRVVFPQDPDDDITPATDPDEVITPVSSISETEETKVWSFGGTVFIEAQPDMDYTIIDLTGRVIKKGATHSTREEVSLNAKGIVIVKIANKSFKIK